MPTIKIRTLLKVTLLDHLTTVYIYKRGTRWDLICPNCGKGKMNWNRNIRPFFSRLGECDPSNFIYEYNVYNQFPVMEMQHSSQAVPDAAMLSMDKNNYGGKREKKRLTSHQLEALENSFQEEMKLEPDRKMKLAKELGLHPREIAIWFQNRRARWKAKQLESLYDALKQEFDVVSMEKQKLQEEVLALRAMVKEQVATEKVSIGYGEMPWEETVESTSIPSSNKQPQLGTTSDNNQQMIMDCNYALHVDYHNSVMHPYWSATSSSLPSYQ